MLAQFQSLYPKGSLISELVQIYNGKYIVKASVELEGVTRATGMAAADTLESAEDHARNRALMVLGIGTTPQQTVASPEPVSSPVPQVKPTASFAPTPGLNDAYSTALNPLPLKETPIPTEKTDTYSQDLSQRSVTTNQKPEFEQTAEDFGMMSDESENQSLPSISSSNVRPFAPRSYSSGEDVPTQTATGKTRSYSKPVDLSDVIAKTDVEMQRLGWTQEQGREHLIKTYKKRGRSLLSPEELQDFLKYLESQTTPIDPLAGF